VPSGSAAHHGPRAWLFATLLAGVGLAATVPMVLVAGSPPGAQVDATEVDGTAEAGDATQPTQTANPTAPTGETDETGTVAADAAGEAAPSGDAANAGPDPVRDRALVDARLAQMPAQRPGQVDLFALAVAGDGRENVFRNEVAYFEDLVDARYGAGGRTLVLVNHPDSLGDQPRPLATPDSLRHALAGIAARM